MIKRVYISGASGSGVSTLGAALAAKLQVPHVDVDDYYWYPTDPPFVNARPPAERVDLLISRLAAGPWVVSGAMDGWGDEVIQRADLVIFIETPTSVRIERLKDRELRSYGDRVLPGGDMHANHLAFIAWAQSYESGSEGGRSRPRHERWLSQLALPCIRVNGELPVLELLRQVLATMKD
ncbi:adenylate kinase [Pseudomonas fragi]|uniref:AAA family ATPase n=1 Tax=Pseudomonas fragi TaxID=296 RepID=UPI000BA24F83|nr:AAA family ATPase [Pseudomonas fragi]PAA22360.1 adenylate kinase [Pseudomonas fragi]